FFCFSVNKKTGDTYGSPVVGGEDVRSIPCAHPLLSQVAQACAASRAAQICSATGAHFSAAGAVFAHKSSTSSGASISVDLAPDSFTISRRASGLSRSGQGRR